MAQPRIIKLEAQTATQNVFDNVNEDVFMPADGDYSNAFGDKVTSKKWFTNIFGTKEERLKRRADRKARRMARKSSRQKKQEDAAKAKALSEGKTPEQASAIATAAGNAVKQQEEIQIQTAGKVGAANAQKAAAAKGLKITEQEVEAARDKAEEAKEAEIYGNSGPDSSSGDLAHPSFWKSMSKGAKITLIGGTAVVLGLIVWGVVASKKK